MRITPLDIQQQTFRTALRGYDKNEVSTFLDLIRGEMEDLLRENERLKEEIRKLEGLLADYREKEQALKDTMITTQKLVDQIKDGAKKEAELVMGQAEIQAERIINQAYQRLAKIIDEIGELKRQRTRYIASFQAVLDTHKKLLDALVEENKEKDGLEDKLKFLNKNAASNA